MQESRILIERFISESKESVITLNQRRKSSRVCKIFILIYALVALSDYSSEIISNNFRNYFLVLLYSEKCLVIFTGVFAEDIVPFFQICCLYDRRVSFVVTF